MADGDYTETCREDHVTTESGIRVMWPQVKECWQPPEAGADSSLLLSVHTLPTA